MKTLCSVLFIVFLSLTLSAQEFTVNTETPDSLRKDALKVYMDANDYIKREIPFINYVRDLKDAQIYIIDTQERSGSGGWVYTYFLEGQHEFNGMSDTVSVATLPDDSDDMRRQKQVSILKMALMRYVAKTPLSKHINIVFTKPIQEEVTTDKWDSWVFRSRINGFMNGQKTLKSTNLFGSFSASRITKDWKLIFDLGYDYGLDKFEIEDDIIKSESNSKSFEALVVKSLNDHWSVGGEAEVSSSIYRNHRMIFSIMPGIEYNVFPYSESTRRQLSFLYELGYRYHNYNDTTVYNKMEESLWEHSMDVTYNIIQKWGSINMGVEWSNYLHDWKLNNLSLSGNMEFRIAKGLSFNLGGSVSLIHDQISLEKAGATAEEILTRQKELETSYSYFTSFGLTYTFGSIYNNVVNPRFRNGGGGGMIIIM
ncbi:MAG: hypothetical protein JXR31_09440 [Prolixibacteraceae bacterium]|nr:hypothetical protein [Prolixibacteraceae bacterium]MBN2774457.1 hypothetical protein [Prolixibacteraceae bacterium]